jgi:hypothetical protein
MKNTETEKVTAGLRDVSRFTRWVNRMDEKDKKLNPGKRKHKWLFTTAVLFALFVMSFLFFPPVKLDRKEIGPLKKERIETQTHEKAESFSIPVDSFENQLKIKMHENLHGKK